VEPRYAEMNAPPGLKVQHVTGIRAVAAISEAEVEGLEVGSKRLRFKPRTRGRSLHVQRGDSREHIPRITGLDACGERCAILKYGNRTLKCMASMLNMDWQRVS
jgi:hypothetical protein